MSLSLYVALSMLPIGVWARIHFYYSTMTLPYLWARFFIRQQGEGLIEMNIPHKRPVVWPAEPQRHTAIPAASHPIRSTRHVRFFKQPPPRNHTPQYRLPRASEQQYRNQRDLLQNRRLEERKVPRFGESIHPDPKNPLPLPLRPSPQNPESPLNCRRNASSGERY